MLLEESIETFGRRYPSSVRNLTGFWEKLLQHSRRSLLFWKKNFEISGVTTQATGERFHKLLKKAFQAIWDKLTKFLTEASQASDRSFLSFSVEFPKNLKSSRNFQESLHELLGEASEAFTRSFSNFGEKPHKLLEEAFWVSGIIFSSIWKQLSKVFGRSFVSF